MCCLFSFYQLGTANAFELETVFRGIPHDALYAIEFEGQEGVSVGANGLVMSSNDSGESWQRSPVGLTEKAIFDVSLSSESGLMVGQSGLVILKESGSEWRVIESALEHRLLAVDHNDTGLAIAVGGFGAVLVSQNFGKNWKPVKLDWEAILNDFVEPHLYDVHITHEGHIYIVGEFELVLRSKDKGLNWDVMHKGDASLFSLARLDSGKLMAVGQRGKVISSQDEGNSWQTLTVNTEENLLSIWLDEQGKALISGIRTMIYSSDYGNNWQRIESGDVSVGWYQGIAAIASETAKTSGVNYQLFTAGHAGKINKIQLQ